MPGATQDDIALGTRAQKVLTHDDGALRLRYPTQARDGQDIVPPGFFDVEADGETVLAARAALIGVEGVRYSVIVNALIWFDLAAYAGVRLIDPQDGIDVLCLVARVEVNCEAEQTVFELFGVVDHG